jgi:hypothetical protein
MNIAFFSRLLPPWLTRSLRMELPDRLVTGASPA